MLEIDVQREAETYLDNHRIFHFRPNADALQSGLPDVIACYRGRFIGLEFKKLKTGRAQGHQKIISKEIANSGGITAFPTSLKDVVDILSKLDRDALWER